MCNCCVGVRIVFNALGRYLAMDAIKRAVGRKFRSFLTKFVDPSTGALVYLDRINSMCAQNRESLEVCTCRH